MAKIRSIKQWLDGINFTEFFNIENETELNIDIDKGFQHLSYFS